jgi:hypothetical protein
VTGDTTLHKIRTLINRYDPEELLACDAPEDEYDPEVRAFLQILNGHEQITGETVSTIWLRYFATSRWPTRRPTEPAKIAAELEILRRELNS